LQASKAVIQARLGSYFLFFFTSLPSFLALAFFLAKLSFFADISFSVGFFALALLL
jgi:hypothetical protein